MFQNVRFFFIPPFPRSLKRCKTHLYPQFFVRFFRVKRPRLMLKVERLELSLEDRRRSILERGWVILDMFRGNFMVIAWDLMGFKW